MDSDRLLGDYDSFLDRVRGATAASRRNALHYARRFLQFLKARDVARWSEVRPSHLDAFLMQGRRKYARETMRNLVCTLRRFLRYLALRGFVSESLLRSVYGPRLYSLASLPRYLSEEELSQLFRAMDLSKTTGRRDYALYALLVSSGLRVGEALRLTLDDIDWRARTIRVRATKTYRERTIPFTPEAGAALIRYLKLDRPPDTPAREVFLWSKSGKRRPLRSGIKVWQSLQLHARRAKLRRRISPHGLRHTFAQNLFDRGAPCSTLQQLLGHDSSQSLLIYTKVALETLREVADNYAEDI